MKMLPEELESLTLDELRQEARRCGLIVGKKLSREQLVALLQGEDERDEEITVDEPSQIPLTMETVAMAKIAARQGLLDEARRICQSILTREPGSKRARAFLEELGETVDGDETTWENEVVAPDPWIVAALAGAGRLRVEWFCDDASEAMALRMLPGAAQRVLRVFSVWLDDEGVRSVTRDESVSELASAVFLEGFQSDVLHRLAFGLCDDSGRFLPICHTEQIGALIGPSEGTEEHIPTRAEVEESPFLAGDEAPLRAIIERSGIESRRDVEPVSEREVGLLGPDGVSWPSGRDVQRG